MSVWISLLLTPCICPSLRLLEEADCSNSQIWSTWAQCPGIRDSPAPNWAGSLSHRPHKQLHLLFNHCFALSTPTPHHLFTHPHLHHWWHWLTHLILSYSLVEFLMFIFALFYGLEPGYDILLFWNMSTCLNNLDCCRLIVALAEIKRCSVANSSNCGCIGQFSCVLV